MVFPTTYILQLFKTLIDRATLDSELVPKFTPQQKF